MALGKRIRNFVPLRAVNNRVIQAEFFRNAHGGTNIVRAVRVNMNGKPLCKQRFQRFELGVEFAQLPFLLRTLLFFNIFPCFGELLADKRGGRMRVWVFRSFHDRRTWGFHRVQISWQQAL